MLAAAMARPAADERPTAYLYLEDGEDIFRVHLDRPRMLIGRTKDNDIRIQDPAVDDHHAVIYWAGGHYVLNVVSKNQGVVNGKVVEGARRLYNGDVIDLSGHVMTFIKVPRVSDTVVQMAIWGPGEVPWFALVNRPTVVLGHTQGDIRVPDEFVGSPHCVIENFCAGALFLVNLDKERGTKRNGVRILKRSRLADGDVLTIGATEIAIRVQPSSALPAPSDLVPLRGVEKAEVRKDDDDAAEPEMPVWRGPRKSVRQILDDLDRAEHGDQMREVVHDFESEDEEEKPYYLPDHRQAERPSAMDGRLDGDVESGLTMMIPVDSKGRQKKDRYYLPEDEAAGRSRRHGTEVEALDTRQDIPVVPGAAPGAEGGARKKKR
jgi:pSer/pThr/pTyr-binding forkhead associated (FHA) protein